MSGCSSIIASRTDGSQWMDSEPGSADLWIGRAAKMLPFRRRTLVPHAMLSSVFGSFNPSSRTSSHESDLRERVDVTALPLDARSVILGELRHAVEDRVGVEVRFRDDV